MESILDWLFASALTVQMSEQEERLLAYSIVNTLCAGTPATSVCFFVSGAQFEGFSGKIYWPGLFYPLPVETAK